MHKIRLEKGVKPVKQVKKKLNPLMMEVIKKEILKLLDVGIIYVISDSPWVSLIHVVLKKAKVIVRG